MSLPHLSTSWFPPLQHGSFVAVFVSFANEVLHFESRIGWPRVALDVAFSVVRLRSRK